jgi:hypothetical protein
MVEDSADDAELIVNTLTGDGLVVDCLRIVPIRALPYTSRKPSTASP